MPTKSTRLQRFYAKVYVTPTGCWQWIGALNNMGYAHFKGETGVVYAHRWAYEHWKGPIPAGLVLDHLCRTPACVNPAHLEAVTKRENALRGNSVSALNAQKTHCKNGHAFTPENTYLRKRPSGGRHCRMCKTCSRLRIAETKRRQKEQAWVKKQEAASVLSSEGSHEEEIA